MKILLDTNFILECVKNKIDMSDLEIYGGIIIPSQVYLELKGIIKDKRQKSKDKEISRLALDILEKTLQ